jgi:hypothetical protein
MVQAILGKMRKEYKIIVKKFQANTWETYEETLIKIYFRGVLC